MINNKKLQLWKNRFTVIIKIVDYIHTIIKIVLLLFN